MKSSLSDWLFHIAAGVGSIIYVLIKPNKSLRLNIIKVAIGYICSIFMAPMILSIFQHFFGFDSTSYESFLPASGFLTGLLGMTFFEAIIKWVRGDMGGILTDIIKSWLERKKS